MIQNLRAFPSAAASHAARVAAPRAARVIAWLAISSAVWAADPDYVRDVKPILEKYCVRCHGPQKQESGLRLDTAANALKGGNTAAAVVPGKAGESLLIKAITGQSSDFEMPPEDPKLQPAEIDLLKVWIDSGAAAPSDEAADDGPVKGRDHWSFKPVVRLSPPQVVHAAWVRTAIDRFILAKLEAAGLEPSPEADRPTLIRRLSFDLLGLPPSPAEVDEFLADASPDAYERLVERVLASPHYGEQWGRHWLDAARYADSNGFTIDGPRSIWKYRDWVIDALNRDLPFDQFTVEQFAGDLLPAATPQQIVATGFHRNTLINQEGGTDPEQFRVESVVDRVNTTGSVFLGLTVGCAQCHSHKFDPITQREYYQFFAFLNNADEPSILSPSSDQQTELAALKTEIAAAEKALADHDVAALAAQAEWERTYAARQDTNWTVLDPLEMHSAGGALMTRLEDTSILVGGNIPAADTYTVTVEAPPGPITAIRVDALTHNTLSNGGPGLSETGNFVLTEFSAAATVPGATVPAATGAVAATAAASQAAAPGAPTAAEQPAPAPLAIAAAYADDAQEAWPIEHALDGKNETGWSFNFKQGVPNRAHRAVFVTKDDFVAQPGSKLVLTFDHQHMTAVRSAFGRFQISVTSAARPAIALDESLRAILAIPAEQRTAAQKEQLASEFRKSDPARAPLAARAAELKQRERDVVGAITTTMVMQERGQPRETHIHLRGDFLHHGASVVPGVPAVLPPLPAAVKDPTRLDLARWLVDANNPLTPRVTVNRLWQNYFGVGLVETENDFGTQGSPPSHPELLDWLASELVAQRWSLKAVHRLIVTSAVYRQASHARPELAQVDPRNRLLARQNRIRLEAEMIRDATLAVSGLLGRRIGGPGVYPPQPEGIYRFTQQDKQWKDSSGDDRYRRGMYTYFWRSSPYPFLITFDAPAGNVACTRRVRSNTPLQALTLANDRAFFEIAQGLAAKVLREAPPTLEDRTRYAFRLCLGRSPEESELRRLVDFVAAQQREFAIATTDAATVAPPQRPAETPIPEAAACTALARVLMNLDEFVTRE